MTKFKLFQPRSPFSRATIDQDFTVQGLLQLPYLHSVISSGVLVVSVLVCYDYDLIFIHVHVFIIMRQLNTHQ